MDKDLLDEYIDLLGIIRDGLKKAEIAMSIPRPDRAKMIIDTLSGKMARCWEVIELQQNGKTNQ